MIDRSEELAARIVRCLPAATFELEIICQLLGVQATREISSAAVEGGVHPRLLINPDFVNQYCRRDEHLFLLVMHELWHILLAHTRLYPRATLLDNIAFDAIINAGLSLQFQEAEYRGFFEAINRADVFPNLLLRPPCGWPEQPLYPQGLPAGASQILQRLYYPRRVGGEYSEPLYEEIRQLLLQNSSRKHPQVVLLGNHQGQKDVLQDSTLVRDVLGEMVKNWPKPPVYLREPGHGKQVGSWSSLIGTSSQEAQSTFSRVLRYSVRSNAGSQSARRKKALTITGGSGVLPNPGDRLRTARQQLGLSALLWQQPVVRFVRTEGQARTSLYLDVSGSMYALLPDLISTIIPFARRGMMQVFQFSNVVLPLRLVDLLRGDLESSGGTDINCVLEHILGDQFPRAVILTDGYTGSAMDKLARSIQEKHIQIHIVLPHGSRCHGGIEEIAASVTVLPAIRD